MTANPKTVNAVTTPPVAVTPKPATASATGLAAGVVLLGTAPPAS